MSTYKETLQAAREFLKKHGIADADVDAWYLLAHVMGINRADFFMLGEEQFPQDKFKEYKEFIEMRANHIPLQHLTKTQEFMGLAFNVNEDVLVPRQDTESLVEEVLKVCDQKSVLDLCTGSGCIIISLFKLSNITKAVGVDISTKALQVAKRNAEKHKAKVEFIHSDLYAQVEGCYDIIVSNPPYIRTKEIETLMPEVKDHEPITALDAGEDGLIFYRRIAEGHSKYLKEGGWLFFEIGHDQGDAVKNILITEGLTNIQIIKDLSGLDRIVCGKRPLK